METNFNIGSLKIVSTPLLENFKKIQANLRENIEVINDKKIPSNFESIDVLRKVTGTLKMLGLTGVNKVLSSISTALEQVKAAKFDTSKSLAVLEASLEITTSVVFYIENLLDREQDQPTKLFEEYQKINNLLGNKVSVKDLFTPKLEFRRNTENELQYALRLGVILKADSKEKIVPFLDETSVKVNQSVNTLTSLIDQGKFNSYEEKQAYQEEIQKLYMSAENIQKLNLSKNVYLVCGLQKMFISIISPVFNDNFLTLAENRKEEIKENLQGFASTVSDIKAAVDKLAVNDKTGTIKVSEFVICNILYFILEVLNKPENANLFNMPIYKEVSKVFDLDSYASQLVNTKVEVSLAQSNPEVAAQIDKLLVEMKEELTLLTSKQASVDTFFQQHSAKFIGNSAKLNELMGTVATQRWKELNDLIANTVLAIKNKQLDFNEVVQKEISLSLVLVEYGINNFVKQMLNPAQKADFELQATMQIARLEAAKSGRVDDLANLPRPTLDAGSQRADERKSMLVIFEKLSKDLKQAEEVLNDIFRDPSNTEDLPSVFKTLSSAKGIFAIIKRVEFSEILTDVITIWKEVGEKGIDDVNREELSKSVELLSGILLYAEATKNDNEIEANEIFHRVMATKNKGKEEVGATFVLPDQVVETTPAVEEEVVEEVSFTLDPVAEFPMLTDVVEDTVSITEMPQPVLLEEPVQTFEEFVSSEPEEVVAVVEEAVASDLPEFIDEADDEELLEVYLMEADEVLENISTSLATLNVNPTNDEELTNIRRYFHTLKGSGRMVGLNYLGEAGWLVEQTLNKVISGDLAMSPEMLAELESVRQDFVAWRKEIEDNKKVKVDLISLKQKWLAVNPTLIPKIDIPDVVAPVATQAEVSQATVEVFEEVKSTPEEAVFELDFSMPEVEVAPVVETPVVVEENVSETLSFDFEVPSAQEEVVVEEDTVELKKETVEVGEAQVEQEVAPKEEVREFININGLDVTLALYNLYKEETESHLKALRESVHSYDGGDEGFEVTYDFMRHAHTLGSIAKSVNMDLFAEFVAKLEFVANTCIDRKLFLKADHFNVLRISVENLDNFANIIDGSLPNNEHFLMLDQRVQDLLNFLTSVEEVSVVPKVSTPDEFVFTETVSFEVEPKTVGEVLENKEVESVENDKENKVVMQHVDFSGTENNIVNRIGEVLDEKLVSLVKSQNYHQDQAEQVNAVKEQVSKLPDALNEVIDKHFDNVAVVIEGSNKAHNQEVQQLREEVKSLKEEISILQKEQKESFDELKRYMRHLNSAIKKKSNLTNLGVVRVQQEEQVKNVESVAVSETLESVVTEDLSVEEFSYASNQLKDSDKSELVVVKSVEVAEEVAETPVVEVAEEVAETPVVEVAEEGAETPVVEVAEEVAENPVVEVAEEVAETPVVEVAEEVAETAVVEVAEDVAETPVVEVAEDVAETPVVEVAEDVAETPVVEVAEEVAETPVVEVAEEVAETAELDFGMLAPEFESSVSVQAPVAKVETIATGIGAFLAANPFVKTIYEEKISTVEDELDAELFEIAQMETDELMEQIEALMENVQSPELNMEQNQELKRHLHTLKGSVRMAGANKIGAIAHRLESLLDYSETRGISLFSMKELLEDELKKIAFMLKNVSATLSAENLSWIDGKYEVETIVETQGNSEVQVDVAAGQENQQAQKKETVAHTQSIRIDSHIIDELINSAGEVRLTRTTLEGMLISNRRSLADLRASSDKLTSMLREIEVQAETQIAAKKEMAADDENFDPLEFDRFTRLQELTRFMNETVADVEETVSAMESFLKTQDSAIVQQSNLTNTLLDTLMKVRLVPVDTISDRLYKITRNTAKELGKRVSLELHGEKTEIDRLVLDKVISPVEHLLRNSIAHGIETPDERTSSGKSIAGKVSFNIAVEGNFITLSIKDDGAGINTDKVRAIAVKKGLLKMGVDYTEKEIVDVIFQSGFSTAEAVSQVAGRGVGMDVVKKEISELGGSIDITTVRGQGTEFKITLPVSVATNHVMLTNVADKLIGIPALNVEEVFSLKRAQIQKAYQDNKVVVKGKEYPMFYLGHLLGLVPVSQLPEFRTYNTLIAVNYLGETIAVHIDGMEATTEVLIKSMGSHFSKISGVLGATLLGDGRQGLIVNPVSLRKHYEQNIKQVTVDSSSDSVDEVEKSGVLTVMVVDDSITVRRATSKVLQRYGYNVVLAKDGEDGLEQLQVVTPDIILSDIEMPRMDGFEFAKNVKNTEKYAGIPIIMITSRTADKHKNYAFSLGVEGFLGKPYQEEELIANIIDLTQAVKV